MRVGERLIELEVATHSAVVAGGQVRANRHWVTIANLRSRLIARRSQRSDQILILVARCLLLVRSLRMWTPVSLKHQ